LRPRIALSALAAVVLGAGVFLGISHFRGSVVPPRPRSSPRASPSPASSATPTSTLPPAALPHVLVVMEENQGYEATQTNCGAANAYFCQLASQYASVVPWFGATHPSLPNYLAVTSGSVQGCYSDGCSGPYPADNLGYQLTQAAIPWRAYMESMPSPCYPGSSSGNYAKKHDPFLYYQDISGSSLCASQVVPYPGAAGLVAALDGPTAPDFVWITPNLQNDLHDGTVAQGNAWLQANLAPVLSSAWFQNFKSTVIVTEDENDVAAGGGCCGDAGGGQIPMLVISRTARGRGMVSLTGDQYGTLRSIEETFGLPPLGAAANPANGDLQTLFG